jgi:hypothetical protein
MPSWKTVFGSFLKQEDLAGRAVTVVIGSVELESVKDAESGSSEKKLVAHFVGKDKAMIINRTNAEALEAITGTDDFAGWVGHPVVLYVDPSIKFGSKLVGGLRIRAVQQAAPPARPFAVQPPPPPYLPPMQTVATGPDITDDDIPF